MPEPPNTKSPKKYDASLKSLVEKHPQDWLAQLGLPSDVPVEVMDADLSTVTAMADKVLHVKGIAPYLLHIELQSARDLKLHKRVLKYNVLLEDRYNLPVHSVVFLLRPEADYAGLNGKVGYTAAQGRTRLNFDFEVVRLWEQPAEPFLNGGVGTLPLTFLCAISREDVPNLASQLQERIKQNLPFGDAAEILMIACMLLQMRFKEERRFMETIFGIRGLDETPFYQEILKKGLEEGRATGRTEGRTEGRLTALRHVLMRLGVARFGEPEARIRRSINAIRSAKRLEDMTVRVLDATDWNELLAQ